jgi:TonB family protein
MYLAASERNDGSGKFETETHYQNAAWQRATGQKSLCIWIELVAMETVSFGRGLEGRVVEGRFPLLERLGGSGNCGSFFTVLKGLQEAVIQLILTGGPEGDAYIAQWEFAMALSHPHLAKVLAAGRCVIDRTELVYVVTERSDATLSKILRSRKLTAEPAREIFNPVLDALCYLHENGVVHGHVNPSNIRFTDSKPKLSVTDLLTAGTATRSIARPGNYDAPEILKGEVTEAADTWSVGMSLWEAMTQVPPYWDPTRGEEPEVTETLPSPFREIVQDCLRADPRRRCTIQSILERLDGSKSMPVSCDPIPVKTDSSLRAADSTPMSEDTISSDEPDALSSVAENIGTEEPSQPVIFSKSLGSFDETPLTRLRFIPYVVVLLAVIAFISVLLFRGHRNRTPSTVASQSASTINPPVPQEQPAASLLPAANPAAPEPSPPISKPQSDDDPQIENQSTPAVNQSVPQPPSAEDQAPAQENTRGLVAKRVLPSVSPSSRSGMQRPVQVLLRVSVNRDGAVSDVAYLTPGPGNYFARQAQQAARSWEFKPPIRNGDPQRSVWTLLFDFGREKTDVTAIEEKR